MAIRGKIELYAIARKLALVLVILGVKVVS